MVYGDRKCDIASADGTRGESCFQLSATARRSSGLRESPSVDVDVHGGRAPRVVETTENPGLVPKSNVGLEGTFR